MTRGKRSPVAKRRRITIRYFAATSYRRAIGDNPMSHMITHVVMMFFLVSCSNMQDPIYRRDTIFRGSLHLAGSDTVAFAILQRYDFISLSASPPDGRIVWIMDAKGPFSPSSSVSFSVRNPQDTVRLDLGRDCTSLKPLCFGVLAREYYDVVLECDEWKSGIFFFSAQIGTQSDTIRVRWLR